MTFPKHLWEYDHPYYMCEGSYWSRGQHANFGSLGEFLDEWADADIDYNRVHRWDWVEGDGHEIESDGSEDVIGRLSVYFIMQRKAQTYSCDITVRRSDEPRVIEYLKAHAEHNAAVWEPF